MKVSQHAKQQTRRSKDALYAHAAMAKALIEAKQRAETGLTLLRLRERPMYYRLNADHTTTPIRGRLGDTNHPDAALEWARQFEDFSTRQIAHDDIEGCLVSTIFLGLDHAWGGGPPVLFETMAFSAAPKMIEMFGRERVIHDELDARRYFTYQQAMAGHAEVVAQVRKTVAQIKAMQKQLKGPDNA